MLLLSLLLCVRVWDSPVHPAQGIAFNVLSPYKAGVNRQWVYPRHPNLCLLRCAASRRGGAAFHSVVPLSHGDAHAIREPRDRHCCKTAVSPKGFILIHKGQWFASHLDCNAVIICISASFLNRQENQQRAVKLRWSQSHDLRKAVGAGEFHCQTKTLRTEFLFCFLISSFWRPCPHWHARYFAIDLRSGTLGHLHHWLWAEAAVQCW